MVELVLSRRWYSGTSSCMREDSHPFCVMEFVKSNAMYCTGTLLRFSSFFSSSFIRGRRVGCGLFFGA